MPIDARLRRLERRVGIGQPVITDDECDGGEDLLSPGQRAPLEELEARQRRRRLAARLGREPTAEELDAETAADAARSAAMVAADAKRRAEMGMPPAPKRLGLEARRRLDMLLEKLRARPEETA